METTDNYFKKMKRKIKKKIKNKKIGKKVKLKINFDYQKVLRFTFIVCALLLSFSFFYYYVFFRTTTEKEKLEQEKQIQQLSLNNQVKESELQAEEKTGENKTKEISQGLILTSCLNTAKEAYLEVFEMGIANCNQKTNKNEKYECASSLIEDTQKGLEENRNECLKNNQNNNTGLEVTNP
jgi:hypothetical protein